MKVAQGFFEFHTILDGVLAGTVEHNLYWLLRNRHSNTIAWLKDMQVQGEGEVYRSLCF